jgi:hypothetical protein
MKVVCRETLEILVQSPSDTRLASPAALRSVLRASASLVSWHRTIIAVRRGITTFQGSQKHSLYIHSPFQGKDFTGLEAILALAYYPSGLQSTPVLTPYAPRGRAPHAHGRRIFPWLMSVSKPQGLSALKDGCGGPGHAGCRWPTCPHLAQRFPTKIGPSTPSGFLRAPSPPPWSLRGGAP